MTKHLYYDVVIVGCGVSGLYTALHLSAKKNILMICKKSMEECDSMLAQGGICVMRDENDYDDFFEDTMRATSFFVVLPAFMPQTRPEALKPFAAHTPPSIYFITISFSLKK